MTIKQRIALMIATYQEQELPEKRCETCLWSKQSLMATTGMVCSLPTRWVSVNSAATCQAWEPKK